MKTELKEKKITFTVHPHSSVMKLIELYYEYNIASIILVNEDNTVIGTVNYSDMFRLLFPDYKAIRKQGEYYCDPHTIDIRDKIYYNGTVNHISSENIDVDMPLIKVLSMMQSGTANQFQVIEDCKVIGVIYFRNLLGSPIINNWSFAIK